MAESSTGNTKPSSSTQSTLTIVSTVIAIIIALIIHGGAAKLSYDKYGSIGWAILAFIFAVFYYPYYAYFVSGRSTSMLGGMLRKMKL